MMQRRPQIPAVFAQRGTARLAVGSAVAAGAALAGLALVNEWLARRAERDNPPRGAFVEVDGVRLHYLERGHGEPVLLIHGNGSMVEDVACSGLIERVAARHRVVAFDRPGFGHSERPRTTVWTHHAQADLLVRAMARIGIVKATVFAHSWGCSVALAMAERHPHAVKALVLASGYYFPSLRSDVFTQLPPALPVIGDVMRHTVSPMLGRLLWPAFLRKIFGPETVPGKFGAFPREMALRPSQIRANAADSALMVPDAAGSFSRYGAIGTPTVIIAGTADRVVDAEAQSARLQSVLPNSRFERLPGAGHMIHQTATDAVAAAIEEACFMHLQRRAPLHAAS